MYVTMNICGHLYTKISYSKHWLQSYIEYESVIIVTHSHSLTHTSVTSADQPTSVQ